ncbi:hypothetical protein HPB49_011126 [Dermacentor silvarum]|uniref:Uncharacterized protein n=1 Tax=Dermacentor silvarum TaxID=543639 RepID=A0ACB8D593_DERSI|nr:hypothetical protein HPB49_011126 [Dermacentor silvarum]
MDFGQSAAFRSSGFIYVALMDHFDVDHGTASWPVSVLGTVVDAGGILAGPLCQWFGANVTLRAGALVTALGIMASVFAPNIAWMTVTLGIIHGAGAGTVSMMLQVFLSMRFVKYRGTAHGIMFMGSILSSLVIPQVLFFLEDAYGFDGCLLIFGALLLHMVPISFLLRSDSPTITSPQYDAGQKALVERRDVNLNIKEIVESEHRSRTSSSSTERKPGVLESAAQVLRLPMFYVILVTWTVMCYNEDIFLTTIVDFAVDKGIAKHLAVPLLSYLSVTDAVGRIGLPLLADRNIIRRSTLVGCNAALTAASVAILPEANSYAFLVVATLLAACFNGCGMTMHGVLMADYIGMDNLPVGYGVAGILVIPLLLIKPLLIACTSTCVDGGSGVAGSGIRGTRTHGRANPDVRFQGSRSDGVEGCPSATATAERHPYWILGSLFRPGASHQRRSRPQPNPTLGGPLQGQPGSSWFCRGSRVRAWTPTTPTSTPAIFEPRVSERSLLSPSLDWISYYSFRANP